MSSHFHSHLTPSIGDTILMRPDTLLYAGAGAAVLGLGYYFFSPTAQQKVHNGIGKAEGKVCHCVLLIELD